MVFPSNGGESFGIVLIEAMAAARPVVLAGDNDGYRSVMADRPELLFDPRDSEALAKSLAKYLQDKQAARQAVAWQTEHVRQFDTATVGAKLVDAYMAFQPRT
jgi:phosphatidylinositol alpha-mannosyltransferase